jgi:SEC-C motif
MKIGRNVLCPCGSGKKYKRCCLAARTHQGGTTTPTSEILDEARRTFAKMAEREAERIEKYGEVRAPISAQHDGHTFVAVGTRLLFDKKWKTFHDFLFIYIGSVFEKEWFTNELSQPLEHRHPLMQWYDLLQKFHAAQFPNHVRGEIHRVVAPPAQISALLSFAYDLYTLEHHSLLPARLVHRVKQKNLFQGARYEAYVAAAFVRAGFTIELEDESDQSSTHCEFSAIHRLTGCAYSVEAKSRHRPGFLGQAGTPKPFNEIEADINGLLVPALRKKAKHPRIVFIDINVPPSEAPTPQSDWLQKIAYQVNRLEQSPHGKDLPPAFIFLTNFPYHFVEKDQALRGAAVAFTGFNMIDFRPNGTDPTSVISKYPAIFALHTSVLKHTRVPHELE